MSEPTGGAMREVRVRRGPKVIVFVLVGAVAGVVATALVLLVTPKDANYSPAQAFGFVALVLATVGAGLGGALAVLLDRRSIRRARVVTAERVREVAAPRIGDPGASVPSENQGDDPDELEVLPAPSDPPALG